MVQEETTMGIFNRLLHQFIEVIEWLDSSNDTLVYRFPVANQEIKMGAQLIVRESQVAIFVNEGQIADVFGPGHTTLSTQNMPVMTMLRSWKYGFNSPFKAEVYFVNTRQFTDLKWGTANPIMLRDREFGMVRLRAFGTYAIRASEPETLLKEIVGTDGLFQVEEISNQLRNLAVAEFTDALGELKMPALDLAGNYRELSGTIRDRVAPKFRQYGLELTTFLIENISLPPEVEEALDKRTSMGLVGDMRQYAQYQAATAIEKAAETGGAGAAGLELGAGLAMGQQMAQALRPDAPAPPTAPVSAPTAPAIVRCPACGKDQASGARYCSDCGASLPAVAPCIRCGAELTPGAKFCSACGAAQTAAKCSACGAPLAAGAKFCSECGAAGSGTEATSTTTA
jgi:membrane protease subunit (stomatin/prohibitin family)